MKSVMSVVGVLDEGLLFVSEVHFVIDLVSETFYMFDSIIPIIC
jgi:hypothetical protein